MKAIILAGGGGTRLWPLSREDFPKQFLNFGSGLSLLQKSVARLARASFIEEIVIATNEHHFRLVQEQMGKIEARVRILVEPLRKNTAPAIAFAVKFLEEECRAKASDSVLVMPSDHLLEPEVIFLHALEHLQKTALEKKIITFGIRPTKPETGYGYIEIGERHPSGAFEGLRFVEKPDLKTAEKYVENPHFFWNSGMFLFSIQTFWTQLQEYCPSLSLLFKNDLKSAIENFHAMPDLSIDYAVMEKTKDILVYPLPVSWSDVGSWDSVYEMMEKDQNQNVKVGQVHTVDTKNSLIIGGKRVISTIGLEDLLIVETEEALLISKKGESQRVKTLLQQLQKKNS